MKCTATQLRKTLFEALERAASGEPLEIIYKGSTIRLNPVSSGSKLSRLKRRNTLLVDPASIIQTDPELLAEMEREWVKDWDEL